MFDVMFRTLATARAALPAQGMGAIPAQLAATLSAGSVRLGARVGAIEGTTLWLHGGRHIEARALLQPVVGQFVEGLDTADLLAAERLLATLN